MKSKHINILTVDIIDDAYNRGAANERATILRHLIEISENNTIIEMYNYNLNKAVSWLERR